jgi:hypothetical protein
MTRWRRLTDWIANKRFTLGTKGWGPKGRIVFYRDGATKFLPHRKPSRSSIRLARELDRRLDVT